MFHIADKNITAKRKHERKQHERIHKRKKTREKLETKNNVFPYRWRISR